MQYKNWPSLLRRIPSEYHEGLLVSTITGGEIVIQSVVHLDEQFLIIRGRPAGSSDGGKVIMIPLANVNYMMFQQVLSEEGVAELFSGETPEFVALPSSANAVEEDHREADGPEANGEYPVEPKESDRNGHSSPTTTSVDPIHPSKALLLAKLRARLQGDNDKPK
ncbi:MAG: hypothetical protein ACFCD0_04305 [Gemmataceae bacterium]